MKKNTLSFRLICHIVLFCAALFVISFSIYYYFTRNTIRQTTRENAIHIASNTVNSIEQILKPAEKIPLNLSWMLTSGLLPKDSLLSFLKEVVQHNENIYGSIIAYEPDFFPEQGRYFAPYAYNTGDSIGSSVLGDQTYEYFYMDWYQIPKMTDAPYWSEPYYDEGGANILMATYSVPFYTQINGNKMFAGVVTIDISLDWLTRIVSEVKILDSGYAYVLSRNGVFITHPDPDYIMNQSIFSIAEEQNQPELRTIGRAMLQGTSQLVSNDLKGRGKTWTYFTPFPSNHWTLGVVFPDREMYSSLHKMNLLLVLVVVAGLILLAFYSIHIIENLTRPLKQFAQSARLVATGKFDTTLPIITTKDEMKELYDSFSFMQKELAEYIINLQDTTTAKEKIESELRIAREIQMGMIPHIFPPFPNLPHIDLFAILKPAKEVGGDLYDFFVLNDKLCFAIGDVSGKGVPASLFMAVTRTLLRSVADKETSPARIVQSLNASLSSNNESSMFVTFFLGMLDINSGALQYSNAGHNPPAIIRKEGTINLFEQTQNPPVGIFEEAVYTEATTHLFRGDKLFLYTDGVSEAENAQHDLFGDDQMIQILREHASESPKEVILRMEELIAGHVQEFAQSDDITMMCIAFNE